MKRKLATALLLSGLCAIPSVTQAATPYVSGNFGLGYALDSKATRGGTSVDDAITYKAGVPVTGAIGLKSGAFRVEAALGYQRNGANRLSTVSGSFPAASTDKVSVFSYMANGYYDYKIQGSRIAPYVMFGIGGASINPEGTHLDASRQNVFAWQTGAGLGFKATKKLVVDLGYRYFKPSSYTVDDSAFRDAKVTAASSNVLLGVRYSL